MNKRFIMVVVFALAVSGVASLVIYRMVAARLSAEAKPAAVQVFVASRGLAIGSLIREADVTLSGWSGPIPAQAVLKKEDVIGRGVIANIYEGEPIVETRLAPRGAGGGLAATIPKGMRAVAVRVNEVVGVAGFVVPGLRVDVLISGTPPGNRNDLGTQTRTILQNIEVLSAGQNIQKDNEGKPVTVQVINLLVTPAQAETLSLASNDARIQLVLRNPLDVEEAKTPGVAMAYLFGKPAVPEPAPKARPAARITKREAPTVTVKVQVVEVLHGAKKAELKFDQPSEVQQ